MTYNNDTLFYVQLFILEVLSTFISNFKWNILIKKMKNKRVKVKLKGVNCDISYYLFRLLLLLLLFEIT